MPHSIFFVTVHVRGRTRRRKGGGKGGRGEAGEAGGASKKKWGASAPLRVPAGSVQVFVVHILAKAVVIGQATRLLQGFRAFLGDGLNALGGDGIGRGAVAPARAAAAHGVGAHGVGENPDAVGEVAAVVRRPRRAAVLARGGNDPARARPVREALDVQAVVRFPPHLHEGARGVLVLLVHALGGGGNGPFFEEVVRCEVEDVHGWMCEVVVLDVEGTALARCTGCSLCVVDLVVDSFEVRKSGCLREGEGCK